MIIYVLSGSCYLIIVTYHSIHSRTHCRTIEVGNLFIRIIVKIFVVLIFVPSYSPSPPPFFYFRSFLTSSILQWVLHHHFSLKNAGIVSWYWEKRNNKKKWSLYFSTSSLDLVRLNKVFCLGLAPWCYCWKVYPNPKSVDELNYIEWIKKNL